ncbi:tRNA uracil 4-sulfurtransferase ThiI [Paenibacillus sp. GCM10023252]|uniref:tRNA uracil 4-sulfurtransferase ThiI n=1 Tax=Paenibacillus sp. GCM10023252 TaxID=3252649 RepID=UPI0036226AEE
MNYDMILLRFGEIYVKGRNRSKFEKSMMAQVKGAMKPYERLTYLRTFGRIFVKLNGEAYQPVAERLSQVFGIVSFSPVMRVDSELEVIRKAALELVHARRDSASTFKVSVKRGWKEFPYPSQEMNHLVGSHILRATPELKVDVRQPELELRVDIQAEGTYIYCEVVQGAGGYPYGSNGKAMLLLSGGIDSPAAGWMALRRGLELEAVHFHSYPFTSDKAKDKVIELAKKLAYYSGVPLKLHLVPFTDIQTALTQMKQDPLIITLMRRSMLRITESLAEAQGALGIVTGDSLGQVASQTLSSMNVIGRATDLPLLRPLITMDKEQIIQLAKDIGTYTTSILPYEDCCSLFLPKSPSTNPNLRVVQKVEEFIPEYDRMIAEAIAGTEQLVLSPDPGEGKRATEQEDSWF